MTCTIISINEIGLIANVIGTILLAFSIGKIPNGFGGTTTDDDGKEFHFAYVVHPSLFKFGLSLIVLGFILQLQCVAVVLKASWNLFNQARI